MLLIICLFQLNVIFTLLSLLVLRVTGWTVLHVVCRTLRSIGTGYRAVLLRYESSS